MRVSTRCSAALTLAALAGVGAASAVWGIGIERHLYALRQHTVRVLPPGSEPLRVLHVSDLHMAPWQHRKQRWIRSLANLSPDLIINTGDNLGHRDALPGVQDAFAHFHGIPGFYVHGSNDKFNPTPRNPFRYFSAPSAARRDPGRLDTDALDAYLRDDLGWSDLNNAAATVQVAGVRVDAFGVSDAHREWDRLDELPGALAALPPGEATLRIGVTHAPYQRVLNRYVQLGADMTFAGHTHGGQVRVPGYGALVANCDIPLTQSRGLSTWRHDGRTIPLNVSAGLGNSIYAPVRFACRPEASLLILHARDE